MSNYVVAGGGSGGGSLSINTNGMGLSYNTGTSNPHTNQTLNIKITPANGGTIIQVDGNYSGGGDLHIIPDGSDFDRELGKIITMSRLKS